MTVTSEWQMYEHKPRDPDAPPRNYSILFWARMHDEVKGMVEVRNVETNPENEILPPEMMTKGPLFPIEGFIEHYDHAEAYAYD